MAIAAKTVECARVLDGILQAANGDELAQEWENQVFRFNLWVSNNLIFASAKASMDWRLRNAPLLESSMVELLDDLQTTLNNYTAASKGTMNEEADANSAVGDALDELFRLSRAIRRSGILRRFVKIDSFIEYDEDGVNLTEGFRTGVERLIRFRLRDSMASEGLRQRVLETVCLRQQYFAYLRKKWGTRQKDKTNKMSPPSTLPSKPSLGVTYSVTGSTPPSGRTIKQKNFARATQAVTTILTATTAQPGRIEEVRSLKSAIQTPEDEVLCSEQDLPLPPKIPFRCTEFECPFCFLVCSTDVFNGEQWRQVC
ncbi:hypothetical protein BDW74DRAFT_184293 [Aspergillus multicolor]|uniref:uncharacterized protein n=1 Tax=Aspergillus multicolor TaxID=41759 RepID=UPI003CCD0BF7